MDAAEMAGEAVRNLRGAGLDAVRELCWRTYLRHGRRLSPDPVVGADWDLLVVLDACRADLWAEIVDEDDPLPVGTTRVSPGGTTTEWLDRTFGAADPETLSAVTYVMANPYSDDHLDRSALAGLEEVWRYAWDDRLGTAPPRPVTDAAVRTARREDPERMVVHYMQPHFPSIADPDARSDAPSGAGSRDDDPGSHGAGDRGADRNGDRQTDGTAGSRDDGIELAAFGEESLSVWEDLRFGRRSPADAWRAYRANLRRVLSDVRLLLSNVDADRAVVTADHGNAFGERQLYGHAAGIALLPMREVPWAVTTATDRGTHDPGRRPGRTDETVDPDVESRLADLGYR